MFFFFLLFFVNKKKQTRLVVVIVFFKVQNVLFWFVLFENYFIFCLFFPVPFSKSVCYFQKNNAIHFKVWKNAPFLYLYATNIAFRRADQCKYPTN